MNRVYHAASFALAILTAAVAGGAVGARAAECDGRQSAYRLGGNSTTDHTTSGSAGCSITVRSPVPDFVVLPADQPEHGHITIQERRIVVYKPNPGFRGRELFTYDVVGTGLAGRATSRIFVVMTIR